MLPRANRLASRQDFARIYARGKQWRSPLVSIYALPRARMEPRFGISVSKKVGGAVQRNLVKRRLREICRSITRLSPPFDMIIVAREPTLTADFELLSESVNRLAQRALKEGSPWVSERAGAGRRGKRRPPA